MLQIGWFTLTDIHRQERKHQDSTLSPSAAEETLAKLSAETGSPLACLYGILDVTFLHNACRCAVCRTIARRKSRVDPYGGAKTSMGKTISAAPSTSRPEASHYHWLCLSHCEVSLADLCGIFSILFLRSLAALAESDAITWRCSHMICMRCMLHDSV